MTGRTLLLDIDSWDLTLDGAGHIATATGAYAIAQNVANVERLFTKDAYYDQNKGIPHFVVELGLQPVESVIRARMIAAAKAVKGVASVEVENLDLAERVLTGTINITTTDGETASIAI